MLFNVDFVDVTITIATISVRDSYAQLCKID